MAWSYKQKILRNLPNTAGINEVSKVVGYKINIQKSTVLLDISHEQPKIEIKKTIVFAIAWKRIITNKVNTRCAWPLLRKYKMFLEAMKEDSIVKMARLPKLIRQKSQLAFFAEIDKLRLKFMW